jgi:hypothetical protein
MKIKHYECCTCVSQFIRKLRNDHLTDISLQLSPFGKRIGFQILCKSTSRKLCHVDLITLNAWAFGCFIFDQIRSGTLLVSDRSRKLTLFLSSSSFFFFFLKEDTISLISRVCIGEMHRCDILEYSSTETSSFFSDNCFVVLSLRNLFFYLQCVHLRR